VNATSKRLPARADVHLAAWLVWYVLVWAAVAYELVRLMAA
jgi:hypothetical protein